MRRVAIISGKCVLRLAFGKDVEIAAARFGCVGKKKADFEGDHGARVHVKILIDAAAVLVESEARSVFFECFVRFCRGCHGHVGVVELDVPAQDAPHFGKCFVPVEQGQEVVVLAYEVVVVDARCGTFCPSERVLLYPRDLLQRRDR